MLLITGVGAMFVNNNWLFIGEILEKIGLRAYFASYFAYILGVLVKRMKIMEQITKRKKEAVVNCTPKVGQKKSNFWGVFV